MIKAFLKPSTPGVSPVVLFGLTDENLTLLRAGRPIKCSLRTEMGSELPDITVAITWGATVEDIVAELREQSVMDENTRQFVVPNTGHAL